MQRLNPVRSFCDEAEPIDAPVETLRDEPPPHDRIPDSADAELDIAPALTTAEFVTPLQ